jgi:TolB protein
MTQIRFIAVLMALTGGGALMASASGVDAGTPRALGPLAFESAQQRTVWDLSLTNTAARPRLGLPDFIAPSADAELRELATTLAEVLWADLDFEKEFYMIPRSESASIPLAPTPETLPTERWNQLGADFVVLAVLRRTGDTVGVRLRLVPVRAQSQGGQPFSYEYGSCNPKSPRACAHYIADHMHKELRGLDGVAQSQLAFVSDRDSNRVRTRPVPDGGVSKEVYIADYDGANVRPVTANRSLTLAPAWAPDSRALAYTLWPGIGQPANVYVNTLDGRPVRALLPSNGDMNSLPAWSPDGTEIAFASNRSGNMEIWVVNRDGSRLRQVTNHPGIDNAPTWSPDGQHLAFASDRGGGAQLYVVKADGTGLEKMTSDPYDHDRPTWSPLGFIAFNGGPQVAHNISILDLATRSITVLTDGVGDNGSPSVAPNGRHIAFATTRWGREQIAIIDRRGQNLRRITTDGNNKSPSWSRNRGR